MSYEDKSATYKLTRADLEFRATQMIDGVHEDGREVVSDMVEAAGDFFAEHGYELAPKRRRRK